MIRFGFLLTFLLLLVACTGAPSVLSIPTLTPAPLSEVGPDISDDPLPTATTESAVALSTPAPSATPVPTLVLSTPWPTFAPRPTAVLLQPVQPTVAPFSAVELALLPTPVLHRVAGSVIFFGRVVDLMDEGIAFFESGRYDEAITRFEGAEREHGKPFSEAQNWIGLSYQRMGDDGSAIDHFTRAIAAGDFVLARVNRLIAYRNLNRCPEAVQDAFAALEMEPGVSPGYHTDVEVHTALASCFARSEDYVLALEHIDMALALAREHGVRDERINRGSAMKASMVSIARGDSYVEDFLSGSASGDAFLGSGYSGQGRFEEAILAFESAQEKNWTPSGMLFHRLGITYSSLGDLDSTLRYLSLALELRDDGYNRAQRAWEYYLGGDCENALVDAEAALNYPPLVRPGFHSIVESFWVRGACRALAGRFDDAIVDFEESFRLAVKFGYSPVVLSGMEETARDFLGDPNFQFAWRTYSPIDCDIVLRQQLVFQMGATTAFRINQVVDRVREQNVDSCPLEIWNPRADDGNFVNVNVGDRAGVFPAVNTPTAAQLAGEGCWLADVWSADDSGAVVESSNDATGADAFVGFTMVPAGLRNDNSLYGTVRSSSGRDSENNIIVYWSEDTFERPADGASCWLYVRSTRTWDGTY